VSVIAVGSLRGSPGATTLAVALAAARADSGRTALVVEADPDGGVMAARFGLGHRPCLTDLAVRARGAVDPDEIWEYAQPLRRGLPVLVGHPSADQCHATLRTGAPRLAPLLDGLSDHDVVVDIGRLRPGSPAQALIDAAALVVVVVRSRLEDIDGARPRLAGLERGGVVLVGHRPYGADEVAEALGIPVLGVVPDDARGAGAVGAATHRTRRLPLLRSVAALGDVVGAHLDGARQR
jgi:MinD-like ATPase involved in chromosome partitioning or flagellar assembly